MEKLIITAAITGGASPEDNPYLPKTPREQVRATLEAYEAGASVVHIHARNPETGRGEHKKRSGLRKPSSLFERSVTSSLTFPQGVRGGALTEIGYIKKYQRKA